MSGDEKESIPQKRNAILNVVKEYIDTILGSIKIKYFKSFNDDNDFQIQFKRKPNSCFVNNYFTKA